MKSLLNYYLAIQHSDYRNHLQKYYRFNIKNEWKNTLTTREHGLGELQDQAPSLVLVFVVLVRHIIEARVLAEERSNLFVLLVCERLWEFRASGVFISTVCMFLNCRRTSYTITGRRWLFSPCFTWFPALGLLLLSWGHILGEKYEYSELRTVLPPWGLWVLWVPPRESWIYMLWGIQSENRRIPARTSVAIARSSNGASRMTAWESPDRLQAWALYRHRRISVRWPQWHRAVIARRLPDLRSMTCGFFPLHFGRWPPDRRMRKSGEESADHPANFNCELNLPDHRRMSPGWVPNRRIAAGFLQDSSPGSPHGDPAIDFAQLWRSYNCHNTSTDSDSAMITKASTIVANSSGQGQVKSGQGKVKSR